MKLQIYNQKKQLTHVASRLALLIILMYAAGCNMLTRLSEVGDGPELSQIKNPIAHRNEPRLLRS